MINETNYILETEDEDRAIIIRPYNQLIPGGDLYATGVFSLSEGDVGIGDIVFDDDMNQWEYTGMGDLTHEEAEEIASYIKNYKDR